MAGADRGRLVGKDGDIVPFEQGKIAFHLVRSGEDMVDALFREAVQGMGRLALGRGMDKQRAREEQQHHMKR